MKKKETVSAELSEGSLNSDSLNLSFSERSEIAAEIISRKPDFIEKWALFVFVILIFLVLIASWVVKYPDIIQAPAKLTSINAPKQVISMANGKLIKLMVKENEQVKQGTILGYLESTANHNEVLRLSYAVDSSHYLLNIDSTQKLQNIFLSTYSHLGELQQSYQTLSQAYLNFKSYLNNGFYIAKKKLLLKDIDNIEKMLSNLEEQKKLQEQDLSLSQKNFEANERLKKDKVISEFDYRAEQSKLISKKLTLPQISAAIISNENQQNDKQKEIVELENSANQQKEIFLQALNTFKSQIEEWKKKYLIVAPITGKVAFVSFIEENQQLQANQIICFIDTENSEYYAQIYIPQTNFGKVAIGQTVLLNFNSYPFQEFGFVKGKIDFISRIPTDSGYLAKVVLSNGLNTSYQKKIQYQDGLTAKGEIITKDLRLLQRFYYNIVQQMQR